VIGLMATKTELASAAYSMLEALTFSAATKA
jgi:hypothetical protein